MKAKQFLHSDKTSWSYLECYIAKFPIGKPSCLSSHYLLTDNTGPNINSKANPDILQKPFFVKDIRKNEEKIFDSGKCYASLGKLRMRSVHKCTNTHVFDVHVYFPVNLSKCSSWLMTEHKSLYSHIEVIFSIINDCYLQNFLLV